MRTRSLLRTALLMVAAALVVGVVIGAYLVTVGVSARARPGAIETFAAHTVRDLAIRTRVGGMKNPVAASDAIVAEGRAHFADHCATCHANDGSGNTEMGRGLYPKAPDMRLPATQNLSDAELFYIIENGVRLTGMPGWSTGTPSGEELTWHLVQFIRHLPRITPDELEQMAALNPRSPDEIRQEIEAEQFLNGADAEPDASATAQHDHGGHHE